MQDDTTQSAPPEAPQTAQTPATWNDLGLSAEALNLISKTDYTKPTPVQAQTIPVALDGYDVIGSAQTGTGKTASFVLPMVDRLAGRRGTLGLILAPTREIAQQIQATLEIFASPRGLRSVVLIGGISLDLDLAVLKDYPEIIVATPGRLCDHLDRGNVWLDYIEVVVLDEADRMLDMGFTDQLNRIMEDVPKSRQTLLFSATMTPTVERLANKIMYEPKRVAIGRAMSAAHTVEQKLIVMREESKMRELYRLMREEKGTIIVFVRSKIGADKLWRALHSAGVYDATCIHSDRLQSLREQALQDFKDGKYRVLIATDVVGRGIHVEDVAHVLNYDLPLEAEDYVHRVGRTGRKETSGKATSFVTPKDRGLLREIERLLKKPIPAEYRDGLGAGGDEQQSSEQYDRGGRGGSGGRSGGGGRSAGGRSSGGRGPSQGGGNEPTNRSPKSEKPARQANPLSAQNLPKPLAQPIAQASADGQPQKKSRGGQNDGGTPESDS